MSKVSWLDECIVCALRREPLTRAQMMDRFGKSKSTMISALVRLRERGLVKITENSHHNEQTYEIVGVIE